MYNISTCDGKDDYDNMCLNPSDGGQYSAADAIRKLENGNGGSMRHTINGKGYMVSYNKSENDWLRKELNIN